MATERALSIEDRKLGTATVIGSRIKLYKDIDLSFAKQPNVGDIYKKSDAAAVKQAMRNLISTNHFEKPFEPDFGADIRALLFELADDFTSYEIKENIRNAAYIYEPRAEILDIEATVRPDNNSVAVSVTFKVINSLETITISTVVNRLR